MFVERLRLIQRAWRYRLRHDQAEIRFVRRTLRRGDTAIDVGAHKGAYTYWMSRAVGPQGWVYAFEPQPELAARLLQHSRGRAWRNVTVQSAAVSAQAGELDLYVPDSGPSPGATLEAARREDAQQTHRVKVVTLDDSVPHDQHVRLIKCDVEGHELDVFRGASRILSTSRPALLFECERRHQHDRAIDDVFAHLSTLGYHGWFFWKGQRVPLADFRLEVHQVLDHTPYANNFVFLHPSQD